MILSGTDKPNKIVVLLLSLLLIGSTVLCFGCGSVETETPTQIIESIGTKATYELIQENTGNPDFKIIDVRTPEEYAEGHIENSVLINISADDFETEIGQLDRDGKYLVYCRSGGRSSRAVDIMQELGFLEVYELASGINAWISFGFSVVK
jgi:rhodanese-related sulfurtransferase